MILRILSLFILLISLPATANIFELKKAIEEKAGVKKDHKVLRLGYGKIIYFKPRNKCDMLSPMFTYYLAQLLGNTLVPETQVYKFQGQVGIGSVYLQGFQNATPRNLKAMLDLPLKQISDINLILHIAGVYDISEGNTLIGTDGKVRFIDNDGRILHFNPYDEWPYDLTRSKAKISELLLDDMLKAKPVKMTVKKALALIKKNVNDKEYKYWNRRLNKRGMPKTVNIKRTKNHVWIERTRIGLPYPHIKLVARSTIDSLKGLNFQSIKKEFEYLRCDEFDMYFHLAEERHKRLLQSIEKGENGFWQL